MRVNIVFKKWVKPTMKDQLKTQSSDDLEEEIAAAAQVLQWDQVQNFEAEISRQGNDDKLF